MANKDDWIGIILGIAGAVALAKLLSQKKCKYCHNYNSNKESRCKFCGGRF